ncbi:MAG: hypothetical protein QM791_05905 [Ferruginibacter sp.]
MLEFIIWVAAFLCPNPNHTAANHGSCNLIHITTGTSTADTGGETGGHPTPPPTPPPPKS